MKIGLYRITQMVLVCCLAAALPAFAQDNHPQQNNHPEHSQAQRTERTAGHPQAQRPAAKPHAAARPQANQRPAQHQAQRPAQRPPNHATRPSPNRAQRRRPSHSRPPQWGRPPARRGSYSFRSNDRSRLHSYYMARLRAINRANRPVFRVGGYFPYAYIGYLSPLPPSLYGTLPPPPYGYQMGYYDGYVVVYDPATYFIASLIDLLQ